MAEITDTEIQDREDIIIDDIKSKMDSYVDQYGKLDNNKYNDLRFILLCRKLAELELKIEKP